LTSTGQISLFTNNCCILWVFVLLSGRKGHEGS
jgi:hypothetical protein